MSDKRDKSEFIDYRLPSDGYLNFDATSLKEYINEKLSKNKWFTDQNFEGSNLSNIIDIVAYSYHTLLFYLNNTSSESMFSEAQIYENINRIVKLINYNPSGFKTSSLSILASSTLPSGIYTVPRYSFFNKNGIAYSFINDATFVKTVLGQEDLTTFARENSLFQGEPKQEDDYVAIGEPNESLELFNLQNVDESTISVFVKKSDQWFEFFRRDTLFFSRPTDNHYTIRYNERQNYQIDFGDGINGQSLNEGDLVSIFYLRSRVGEEGQVSANFISNEAPTLFANNRLREILNDINDINYISQVNLNGLSITTPNPSTENNTGETVDDIRQNAPIFYESQNRLISRNDFVSHIRNNFSGFIGSVKVLNNREFLDGHIKYLNDIGVTSPFRESRILVNQWAYSAPANFNNVYIYVVPRIVQKFSTINRITYLNNSQKQLILDSMEDKKEISLDIILQDPIFMAVNIGLSQFQAGNEISDIENTKLRIRRASRSINSQSIVDSVVNVFSNYFSTSNFELGQVINLQDISNQIFQIRGVSQIETVNGQNIVNGINMYVWDVVYNTNLTSTPQNLSLRDFQYAFFFDLENLKNKIEVVD